MVTRRGEPCLGCGTPCAGWFCGDLCRQVSVRPEPEPVEAGTVAAFAALGIFAFQLARVYALPRVLAFIDAVKG